MNTVRRRGATALTAAIALALGGIPAAFTTSSILAAGEGPTTTLDAGAVPLTSKMTLTSDGTTGTVAWNGISETFTGGRQCQIDWAADAPTLLELQGSMRGSGSALAGFRDGQIGVFEPSGDGSPTNASQCFRIDSGSFDLSEVLTVSLGNNPALVEKFGNTDSKLLIGEAKISYAVTSKTGAFDVTVVDANGQELGLAPSVTWGLKKVTPGTILTTTLALPADTLISSFSLTPKDGTSFSLLSADLTLYSQRDDTFCKPGDDFTNENGTTVTYLGNADGTSDCFGVQLTSGDKAVNFYKPLDVSPDAQFIFDQTWTEATKPGDTPDYTLNKTFVNFEFAGSKDNEMPFCPDELIDAEGHLQLVGTAALEALLEAEDPVVKDWETAPGIQFACINKFQRTTSITSEGLVVHDELFLSGDAALRFR